MDIPKQTTSKRRRAGRAGFAIGGLALLMLSTVALARLKAAAPSVDRSSVWTDTVKRGPMTLEVHGLGTLVPKTTWTVPASTDGRVAKRYLLPGTAVNANTVILVLTNPQLEQETLDAKYQLKGAEATLEEISALVQNQLMERRTAAAAISSQYRTAEMQKDAKEQLMNNGLAAALDVKTAEVQAEELEKQNDLAEKEVEIFANSSEAQLAVQRANVDQKRALYKLKTAQLGELQVRPGINGVLQELDVDVGQQVRQGTVLLKVVQPMQLKASLQIPETRAKDLSVGQEAFVDTHNGIIPGHVIRIDPAVVNGTRAIDIELEGSLPDGAVPQLTIEGTVEIERLADVLYVGRPVHGDADTTVGLFKLVKGGKEAVRVPVMLGRASVNAVEIRRGLEVGDEVILSDMTASESYDRIRLQ